MSDPFLLPEDWAAAKEVLSKSPCVEHERERTLKVLAQTHAEYGKDRFRLRFGLRQPRHAWEQLELKVFRKQSGQSEWDTLKEAVESEPLTGVIAGIRYDEIEEALYWMGRFYDAVIVRAHYANKSQRCGISETERDRYLLETKRKSSLIDSQHICIVRFAEDVRVLRDMKSVVAGEWVQACAISLATHFLSLTHQLWDESCEHSEAHSMGDEFDFEVCADVYMFPYVKMLPSFNSVAALLREEAAAVRIAFNQQSTAAPIQVINNIQVPSPSVTVNNIVSHPTNAKRAPTGAKTQDKPPLDHELRFSNWAIGLEDGKKWWLFHFEKHGWEHRRQVKIPSVRPHRILTAIAEGAGMLDRDKLIVDLRPDYKGHTDIQIKDKLKYAMSDVRERIREAISETTDRAIPSSSDPIPLIDGVWRAAIQVGFAYQDDHKQLAFRFQS